MTGKPVVRIAAWLVVVSAACSTVPTSSDESTTTSAHPETTTGESFSAASTTTLETSTTSTNDSLETLADFFGVSVFDDPQAEEAAHQEFILQFQEALRMCMAEQGFDYMPVLPREDVFRVIAAPEEERVRERGFLITTDVGSGLPDAVDSAWFTTDPNEDRVAAMSEAEREAWDGMLSSCEDEASADVPGSGLELAFSTMPEIGDLDERLDADPRVVELESEWSRCMGEQGYEYSDRDDLLNAGLLNLRNRFEALMGDDSAFNPFAGWAAEEIQQFVEGKSDEEIQAFFREEDQKRLDRIDAEALAALQQEEIDLAVADLECRRELDYDETRDAVRKEVEANFIDSNREALEQIRDSEGG
jgi:hypothetical protein